MKPNNPQPFPFAKKVTFIHLTMTMMCNSRCKGCINSNITFKGKSRSSSQNLVNDAVPERDSKAIASLIRKENASSAAICFYGGEPLLVPVKICQVMNLLAKEVNDVELQYMVYTNGIEIMNSHLKCPELNEKVWLYSVSIDGSEENHDYLRRGAPLGLIKKNLEYLKDKAQAKILMWSTIREEQTIGDCFQEFLRLEQQGLVQHFFWHLIEIDEPFNDFIGFAGKYEDDLREILLAYIKRLEQGEILSIIHLNELILYLLTGKARGSTACGVELAKNYDIMGGAVHPCADLPAEYSLGVINDDGSLDIKEQDLARLVSYKDRLGCFQCGVHPYCGGRCPVLALTCSDIRINQYCQLMRLHVAVVTEYLEPIRHLLELKDISLNDIYEQSAFLAQFTDVTP